MRSVSASPSHDVMFPGGVGDVVLPQKSATAVQISSIPLDTQYRADDVKVHVQNTVGL
jgi:hypothetical protein